MKLILDHVTICGSQLGRLQQGFANAGLAPEYGGPHANGLTHMASLGFENGSYLELIAPLNSDPIERSPWGGLMLGEAGPGAWAVGATNLRVEVKRLRSQGIEVSDVEGGSRNRPDGKQIEWMTASVGPGSPGAMLPFIIEDHTPREWRVQPSPGLRGSGLTGIAAVVLGVANLNTASELFQRAFEWDDPVIENHLDDHTDFAATVAHFFGTPVMLAAPAAADSWLSSRLANFGEIPAAFLLQTGNLTQAAKHFRLSTATMWFGRQVAWFDSAQLGGTKLGVVQP